MVYLLLYLYCKWNTYTVSATIDGNYATVAGDRKYKIPPIDPLEVTEISVDNEGPKQAGIEIKLKKAKFHGLKDTIFKDVKYVLYYLYRVCLYIQYF